MLDKREPTRSASSTRQAAGGSAATRLNPAQAAVACAALARAAAAHHADPAVPQESADQTDGADGAPSPAEQQPPRGRLAGALRWALAQPSVLTTAGLTCIGLATALVVTSTVGVGTSPVVPEQKDGLRAGAYQDPRSAEPSTGSALPASQKATAAAAGASRISRPASAAVSSSHQASSAAASAPAAAPSPTEEPAAAVAVLLRVAASGGCLTAQPEGLVVSSCASSPGQEWVLADGMLRSGEQCATVPDGQSADRTPVVMSACAGLPGQRFGLSSDSLRAAESGKCLDLFGGASGTDVVLWECNGRDNQRWSAG